MYRPRSAFEFFGTLATRKQLKFNKIYLVEDNKTAVLGIICGQNLQRGSLFQAFGWCGAGKKLGRRRKIDEGNNIIGQ